MSVAQVAQVRSPSHVGPPRSLAGPCSVLRAVNPRRPQHVPVLMTREEVRAVLQHLRNGKGAKDRITMLPAAVTADLTRHLEGVRRQHEADLQAGAGWVELPTRWGGSTPTPAVSGAGHGSFRPHGSTSTARPGNAAVITSTSPSPSAR